MLRWYLLLLFLLLSTSLAEAVTFNHVVTLGDSLLDDTTGGRSPVAAEHVAQRLGVSVTKFAQSGSTSSDVIAQGQHTQAAAQFGNGDLAMLWIGGNDFFTNPLELAFGDSDFLNVLESNTNTALATLHDAGMEIVVFNLPDMSQVPGVIDAVNFATILTPFLRDEAFENITGETVEWNSRLNNLAANYGATVVDVFSMFNDLAANPSAFSILGHDPILNADTGCQYCVFFDDLLLPDVHPSSFAQGFIANEAIELINAEYDPSGTMPLETLSTVEIALLADLYAGDFDGDGVVTGTDLMAWETHFGTSGNLGHWQGNADGDHDSDGADFLIWQRQFMSQPLSATALQAIPEPTSVVLWIAALLSLPKRRWQTT